MTKLLGEGLSHYNLEVDSKFQPLIPPYESIFYGHLKILSIELALYINIINYIGEKRTVQKEKSTPLTSVFPTEIRFPSPYKKNEKIGKMIYFTHIRTHYDSLLKRYTALTGDDHDQQALLSFDPL